MGKNGLLPFVSSFVMKRFFCLAILSLVASPLLRAVDRQPNVVFILADDLGYGDTGAYGQ